MERKVKLNGWSYVERVFEEQGQGGLEVEAARWVALCGVLSWQEQRLLILPENPEPQDLRAHKTHLENAIKAGEGILNRHREAGGLVPPNGEREIENLLKNIKLDYRMRYAREEFSLEESDAFINRVFGED